MCKMVTPPTDSHRWWICVFLFTVTDKRSTVMWMAKDEPRSEVFRNGFRSRKLLISIFTAHHELLHWIWSLTKSRSLPHTTPPPFYQRSLSTLKKRTRCRSWLLLASWLRSTSQRLYTWIRKTYTWWNIHPIHLNWHQATFGCFPK